MRIAVVGLGFGRAFVPSYLDHPEVDAVFVVDPDDGLRERVALETGGDGRYGTLEQVLSAPDVDAVHLATPIPLHAEQAVAALNAGKHTASAVPAGLALGELAELVAAERSSGRRFMMFETAVYTTEFLEARRAVAAGELGRIQLLRGVHFQLMEGWPSYWRGLPPMLYGTHAIAPLLELAGTRAADVRCLGSGRLADELRAQYGNPYPIETALFRLEGSDAVAEVTRSHFALARQYQEGFAVYGDLGGFESGQLLDDEPVRHRRIVQEVRAPADRYDGVARPLVTAARAAATAADDELPPSIRHHVVEAAHGGSHPRMVHEFVTSIAQDRPAAIDATTAAQWTAAGICAHESALRGGAVVEVPSFA